MGLLLGACGGSAGSAAKTTERAPVTSVERAPGTTHPVTTTTTIEDVKAEVEAAYREAEASYYEMMEDPTMDVVLLSDTRADVSLDVVTRGIESLRRDGLYLDYGGHPPNAVILDVRIVDATTARLTSCVTDDGLVKRQADDVIVDDDLASYRYLVELARLDGGWKVSSETSEVKFEDQSTCGE